METNSNDITKNIVLSLEVLSKEYDVVLIQYNQAQQNYIDYLQSQKNEPSNPLTFIKGFSFLGSNGLVEQSSTSVEDCQALCSADASCSGATFNSDSQYCMTRTGEGSIISGSSSDYAIIPTSVKYLNIIKNLNEKLSDINKKILFQINKGDPLYSQQSIQRKEQGIQLAKNYNSLKEERDKIENIIKDNTDLIKSQDIGNIYISQKYSIFIGLTIILFIIIFLFFKIIPSSQTITNVQYGGGILSKKVYILIFIMILITLVMLNFITK